MDLPTALKLISALESQLKELENMSKDYESEMEQVIDKLRGEYIGKCDELDAHKRHTTKLEIQLDDLESENAFLTNKMKILQVEADRQLERSVLLEHELHDTREKLKTGGHLDNKKKMKRDNDFLQVSTSGSTLLVMPRSQLASTSDTKLNTSKVISTTFHGNKY